MAWDGRGLPPAAQARIARAAGDHVRTSLLSSAGTVALADCGMTAVGEVMGCVVEHIGWGGWGCGNYYGSGFGGAGYAMNAVSRPTQVSGAGGLSGYAPYVKALYYGYEQALHRMLLEAQALGADGVVDVRLTVAMLDEAGNREFVAIGTAVRATGSERPAHLFSTDVSGEDVAKLLHAGWVPAGLVVGLSVGVRHDDYYTRQQARYSLSNQEVEGYSELLHATRSDARRQFAIRATKAGGDAGVVSDMHVNVWSIEPSDGHRDHVALSVVTGTAIAQVHRGRTAPTDSTPVLMLTPTRRTPRSS